MRKAYCVINIGCAMATNAKNNHPKCAALVIVHTDAWEIRVMSVVWSVCQLMFCAFSIILTYHYILNFLI